MPRLIAGIDLGTSTSAIGYFHETPGGLGTVKLVQGDLGVNWIRSSVLYDPEQQKWLAGGAAWTRRKDPRLAPYHVVSAKRHLGVDAVIPLNGSSAVTVDGSEVTVTPELVLSKLLQQLKQRIEGLASDFTLGPVVVAIPMVYTSDEASLTRRAVELAGLELLDFIQEPTAAALCYVHESHHMHELREGDRILVFDLGGGTFDLTAFELVERSDGELALNVLRTGGIRRLGGDDVDELILRHLREKGLKLPREVPPALREEIREEIETYVKVPLSNADDPEDRTTFSLDRGRLRFHCDLSQAEFVGLLEGSEFAQAVDRACRRIREETGPIKRVMLVGGSAHLPICKPIVQRTFGPDVRITSAINMQEAVVRGAVYRAAQLQGRATGTRRITLRNHGHFSSDFGVIEEDDGGLERFSVLLARNTPYPMPEPLARSFRVCGTEPLIVECLQGDAATPFLRGGSAHHRFAKLDHGVIPDGTPISIAFQANQFGEIVYTACWGRDGRHGPLTLRPAFER